MKLKDYEDHLKSALSVYRIDSATMDALQEKFLVTLAVLAGAMGLSLLLDLVNGTTLFNAIGWPENINILESWALAGFVQFLLSMTKIFLFLVMLASFIPYSIDIVKLALKKKDDFNLIQALSSDSSFTFLKVLLAILGFSLLALWPYILGNYIIASKSNIFEAYTMIWALIGGGVSLYFISRILGAFVLSVAGKNSSLAETFQRTHGHAANIVLILVVTCLPLGLLQMFFSYSLGGLLQINLWLSIPVQIMMILISSVILLLQSYLMWSALTHYMKASKLLS